MTHRPATNSSAPTLAGGWSDASGDVWPDDPFWNYSLAIYRRVREPALELQSQAGADVNVLLFCCWVAACGRGALSRAEMTAALAAVRPWQREVIQPLRMARQFVKAWAAPESARDQAQALRAGLQAQELAAERVEHILLSAAIDRPAQFCADPAPNGMANLRLYFEMAELPLDLDGQTALHVFWRAAFTSDD